jgi:hypothetical protein
VWWGDVVIKNRYPRSYSPRLSEHKLILLDITEKAYDACLQLREVPHVLM